MPPGSNMNDFLKLYRGGRIWIILFHYFSQRCPI
jgi:hypothetical protein